MSVVVALLFPEPSLVRVTIDGLAVPVTPDGPLAVTVTVPLNPLTPFSVTTAVLSDVPRATVTVVGLTVELKPVGATTRPIVLAWTIPLLAPVAVMVTEKEPLLVEEHIRVSVPDGKNARLTLPPIVQSDAPVPERASFTVSENAPKAW